MAFTEEKFNKQLAVANIKLEEISELSNSSYVEDISLANVTPHVTQSQNVPYITIN